MPPLPQTAVSLSATVAAGALLLRERRITARLERLGAAALETLLAAIDANDSVTGAHVRRVARYSLILGEAADLDPHTCRSVERVALFHDIGKIHEALFDVIHDDMKLSPADRRAINTHPRRGAEVLAPLATFYPDLPEGVLSHHERWDGTGYPRKLKGERIPFNARIVAIADTFDAMTHKRRYRAAKSFATAISAISAGRGRQFDPDLVDLFMSTPVLKEIHAEMRKLNRRASKISPATRSSPTPSSSATRRDPQAEQLSAPDVSFRWRDTAPALRRANQRSRK